jgi:hypothetical protein
LVNYGYDCIGWTPDAKEELASELAKIAETFKDQHGKTPTIEVNGTYPGVRIRKMTWLTEEQILELTDQADRTASYVRIKHGMAQTEDGVSPMPLYWWVCSQCGAQLHQDAINCNIIASHHEENAKPLGVSRVVMDGEQG